MTTVEKAHPPENPDRDPDTEETLARIHALAQIEKDAKAEREKLRDALLQDFAGSRYFVDSEGYKRYAFRVDPEPIEVDVKLLASYVSAEVLDEVTERTLVTDKFKKAVETERIPAEVFVKVARKVPRKGHLRFGDPQKPVTDYAGAP